MQTRHVDFLDLLDGHVQYVVPRWQRRYRWEQADIERLVDDLVTVADAESRPTHYGGTLLTFREQGVPGTTNTIHVVDGQQRLTTVSILLNAIADKLGPEGACGEWNARLIREERLTNPRRSPDKHRKLRLQDGDEDEYRHILDGTPKGSGAVTQAWRIARRLVEKHGEERLLRGLQQLKVVSIALDPGEDPQQIFESLNATGRPLTESEKVKNWLLMGLSDEEQQHLHEKFWRAIEKYLGTEQDAKSIDVFLRDLLRWRTGDLRGIDRSYEGLRRWAVRCGHDKDRPALCRDLARLAHLYGYLTGTAGVWPDARVEAELRHLRAMRFDTHRPLTLRLLDDVNRGEMTNEDLAKVLAGIGTWVTRMWLADRKMAGMNRAAADLAGSGEAEPGTDIARHWLGQFRTLRNTRTGVPDDAAVRQGIRSRKAYGGGATQATFAVLCALMEAEHREESPARDSLTVEHIMPQKLTEKWQQYLGENSDDLHRRFSDRLANLTLSGDITNARLGVGDFSDKKKIYKNSSIGITRRLANESQWNEEALDQRAEDLARRVLERWPWVDKVENSRKSYDGA